MVEKFTEIVCNCELDNGYIFKNYFVFSSLRARPTITFMPNKIISANRTADNQIYGCTTLYGDETNLVWDQRIPSEQRTISLTFDAGMIPSTFGRIKKKDQARITVAQMRNRNDPHNFSGPNSSDEFVIYVSCGTGGDGREGLRSIPASRATQDNTLIRYPDPKDMSMLVIPVKSFRQMVDSFTKCKKESIKLRYYTNNVEHEGQTIRGRPGLTMKSDNGILEKYGEIPDEESLETPLWSGANFPRLSYDENHVIRPSETDQGPLIEIEELPDPNEFNISADKIGIFAKLASMHNEGNVRFQYHGGHHLCISYRYGAFGEAEICISNKHVRHQSQEQNTQQISY
jgi:hypothetical protein